MKVVIALLVLGQIAAANSCTTAGGSWSTAGTWSSCGGTTPQPGDTATLTAGTLVLNTNPSLVNLTVTGGTLTLDGAAPRTITCSAVSVDCIEVQQTGATYGIDLVAGSTANSLTIVATSLNGSHYPIAHRFAPDFVSVGLNLPFLNFNGNIGSAPAAVYLEGNAHTDVVNITHGLFAGIAAVAVVSPHVLLFDSNTISGMTGTITLNPDFSDAAMVTNNTETVPAAAGSFMRLVSSSIPGFVVTGNAIQSNPNGLADRTLLDCNGQPNTGVVASVFEYNLGLAYAGTSKDGIVGCRGISAAHWTIDHNVLEAFHQGVSLADYDDTSLNIATGTSASSPGQGVYINLGTSHITQSRDSALLDSTDGSNFGIFHIGSGGAADSISVSNSTIIGVTTAGAGGAAIRFGEGSGADLSVTNGLIKNTLSSTWYNGVSSANSSNAFVSTCTGSVGVCGSNIYNTLAGGAAFTANGTNFGTSPAHPSSTYGDLTNVNPAFYSTTRRMSTCDAILGGAGTYNDLFTKLGNRYNGTNGSVTPQAVWNCMQAPLAPQNTDFAVSGVGSTFIGAYPPSGLIGSFIP